MADIIPTKVVGVTQDDRQKVIGSLHVKDSLILVREPSNPYDANAILVKTVDGRVVGYLKRELAAKLSGRMDFRTHSYAVRVENLTGGDKLTKGCNIFITETEEVSQ